MRVKALLILLAGLSAILLAGNTGITSGSFLDEEESSGNTLQAWVCQEWVQTTQADFSAGVANQVDSSSNPGDVLLLLSPNPTLITSDNSEVSTSATEWELVKRLTFTKDGVTYDELRIDSNLKADHQNFTVYSSIRVDDVEKFTHSTASTSYESYSDTLDFSGYSGGQHTIELYLKTSKWNKPAYNSAFELYRTKVYVSSGTLASQVRDTGITGAKWDALSWSETLPASTDITFEVRASDTQFDKSGDTPSWTGLGVADSPIESGLPRGQYMQWRTTLTTSDASKTPNLHEVTITYY